MSWVNSGQINVERRGQWSGWTLNRLWCIWTAVFTVLTTTACWWGWWDTSVGNTSDIDMKLGWWYSAKLVKLPNSWVVPTLEEIEKALDDGTTIRCPNVYNWTLTRGEETSINTWNCDGESDFTHLQVEWNDEIYVIPKWSLSTDSSNNGYNPSANWQWIYQKYTASEKWATQVVVNGNDMVLWWDTNNDWEVTTTDVSSYNSRLALLQSQQWFADMLEADKSVSWNPDISFMIDLVQNVNIPSQAGENFFSMMIEYQDQYSDIYFVEPEEWEEPFVPVLNTDRFYDTLNQLVETTGFIDLMNEINSLDDFVKLIDAVQSTAWNEEWGQINIIFPTNSHIDLYSVIGDLISELWYTPIDKINSALIKLWNSEGFNNLIQNPLSNEDSNKLIQILKIWVNDQIIIPEWVGLNFYAYLGDYFDDFPQTNIDKTNASIIRSIEDDWFLNVLSSYPDNVDIFSNYFEVGMTSVEMPENATENFYSFMNSFPTNINEIDIIDLNSTLTSLMGQDWFETIANAEKTQENISELNAIISLAMSEIDIKEQTEMIISCNADDVSSEVPHVVTEITIPTALISNVSASLISNFINITQSWIQVSSADISIEATWWNRYQISFPGAWNVHTSLITTDWNIINSWDIVNVEAIAPVTSIVTVNGENYEGSIDINNWTEATVVIKIDWNIEVWSDWDEIKVLVSDNEDIDIISSDYNSSTQELTLVISNDDDTWDSVFVQIPYEVNEEAFTHDVLLNIWNLDAWDVIPEDTDKAYVWWWQSNTASHGKNIPGATNYWDTRVLSNWRLWWLTHSPVWATWQIGWYGAMQALAEEANASWKNVVIVDASFWWSDSKSWKSVEWASSDLPEWNACQAYTIGEWTLMARYKRMIDNLYDKLENKNTPVVLTIDTIEEDINNMTLPSVYAANLQSIFSDAKGYAVEKWLNIESVVVWLPNPQWLNEQPEDRKVNGELIVEQARLVAASNGASVWSVDWLVLWADVHYTAEQMKQIVANTIGYGSVTSSY